MDTPPKKRTQREYHRNTPPIQSRSEVHPRYNLELGQTRPIRTTEFRGIKDHLGKQISLPQDRTLCPHLPSVRARHTSSTAVTPQLRPQIDNCPAAGDASGTVHHKHTPVDASNPSSPPALHYPRIHMINSCTGSTPQKPSTSVP